ncbi:MAG: prepilin-type N-terminal cleavage/methylation domain-containing protein [Pirellulaceae bacterium]
MQETGDLRPANAGCRVRDWIQHIRQSAIPNSKSPIPNPPPNHRRRGLSLIELLVATTILALIAGALAALASAVQVGSQYNAGMGNALQHGRVGTERIQRALNEAPASNEFPGFLVLEEQIGIWKFPDTLVVWRPPGDPANPDGLPLISELVVFCPDPAAGNRLLEITVPADTRPVPAVDDLPAWQSTVFGMKTSGDARRVLLTDLLRMAMPTGVAGQTATPRGVARFQVELRPSEAQWNDFLAGALTWDEIAWAQDIHGTQSGLRQSWCRFELQLIADHVNDNSVDAGIPFFGTGAIYYSLQRP